jgi:DNA-binding NarL/FixJ family response regulator
MSPVIHVKVCHRSRIFRECLAGVLSLDERFQATDADHGGPEFLPSLKAEPCDVVLVDSMLPDGLAVRLAQDLQASGVAAKVLLLAGVDSHEQLFDCIADGVHGCVSENSSIEQVRAAVEQAVRGETVCSPEILGTMFASMTKFGHETFRRERANSATLTRRELEIVELIAQRLSNKQIAKRLSLSLYTVKNHVHNIVEKLHVEDRHEAVEYARRHQWLTRTSPNG